MMLAGETAAFGGVYGLLMAFWEGLGVTGGCTTFRPSRRFCERVYIDRIDYPFWGLELVAASNID